MSIARRGDDHQIGKLVKLFAIPFLAVVFSYAIAREFSPQRSLANGLGWFLASLSGYVIFPKANPQSLTFPKWILISGALGLLVAGLYQLFGVQN